MENNIKKKEKLLESEELNQNIVAKRNDFITNARHDLTPQQIKIVDYVISKIKPDDKEITLVKTSLNELATALGLTIGGKNFEKIYENLKLLRKKEINLLGVNEDGSNDITTLGWFSTIKVEINGEYRGDVTIQIAKELTPYFIGLTKQGYYTQYYLSQEIDLKSSYGLLLFEYIEYAHGKNGYHQKMLSVNEISQTVDEWKNILARNTKYTTSEFVRTVMQRAIKDINNNVKDINIDLEKIKKGRSIKELKLIVRYGTVHREEQNDLPKIPIFKIKKV